MLNGNANPANTPVHPHFQHPALRISQDGRQPDGLSAYQRGSLEKSFSPRNKATLYSSGTTAHTADTEWGLGVLIFKICLALERHPTSPEQSESPDRSLQLIVWRHLSTD